VGVSGCPSALFIGGRGGEVGGSAGGSAGGH
jgi:hypothetical protein